MIEVRVEIDGSVVGVAEVPSGASRGTLEAAQRRDENPNRDRGAGVRTAVASLEEEIADTIFGQRWVTRRTRCRPLRLGWHGEEGTPRREAHRGHLYKVGSWVRSSRRRRALPVARTARRRRAPTGTTLQCGERWGPRSDSARLPGVHDRADRDDQLFRDAAGGCWGLWRSARHLGPERPGQRSRRRGWFRARPVQAPEDVLDL
jgi:hypothetical protein